MDHQTLQAVEKQVNKTAYRDAESEPRPLKEDDYVNGFTSAYSCLSDFIV